MMVNGKQPELEPCRRAAIRPSARAPGRIHL
jgi:hypothetical protein